MLGVVAERTSGSIDIVSFLSYRFSVSPSTADLEDGLRELMSEAETTRVALALDVPDAMIRRLSNQEQLHARERSRAAKTLAEGAGFGKNSGSITGRDGTVYVTGAKPEVVAAMGNLVDRAGGSLVWLDYLPYAWAAVLPDGVQSLVLAGQDSQLIIVGAQTIEIGVYPAHDFGPGASTDTTYAKNLAQEVLEETVRAAQANFADVDVIAVLDTEHRLGREFADSFPSTIQVRPFELELEPDKIAWAVACGLALRALHADSKYRIHHNFALRRAPYARTLERIGKWVSVSDVTTVLAGVAAAVMLFGWRYETLEQLNRQVSDLSLRVANQRHIAQQVDRDLAHVTTARSVMMQIDGAQRTGPLAARDVARVARRLAGATSATSLVKGTGTDGSLTLTGHAQSMADVASLMSTVNQAGYYATLSSTQREGSRLNYNITLVPVDAQPVVAAK
jgi:hypothetical protein